MSSALDGILGGLVGRLGGGSALGGVVGKLAPALVGMLAGGGLAKVVSQFQGAGLGSHADSWVGTGENEPITSDHVKQALSEEQIAQVAQQLGVSTDEAAAALAHALPEAVNHLTPAGHVPDPAQVDQALKAPAAQ
jgi:uncharacterized protein YidB (DUF937 family)